MHWSNLSRTKVCNLSAPHSPAANILIGITVRGNAVSLQIMLRQRSSGFTFISREDLPPCPSVVLLAQALKRCWALIEQVREPKLRGPSNTPLTARGASPFNSDSIRDQNGEISQGNPEKFDNQMRLTGTKLGLAYNQNQGDPMIWNAIGAWSCKLSFALDETSVRSPIPPQIEFANLRPRIWIPDSLPQNQLQRSSRPYENRALTTGLLPSYLASTLPYIISCWMTMKMCEIRARRLPRPYYLQH